MKKIDEIINEESISKEYLSKIICLNCGEEILEDELCIQVRLGTLTDGEFYADEDLTYYHRDCCEY